MTSAVEEVVGLAHDLIRIDTTNTGDEDTTVGERKAAEYVVARLEDVGYRTTYLEAAPGRANVVTRLPGADPSRGALLVHAHLDVVPFQAAEWSVHPLSGEVRDGYLWGRGAVDMKHMAAMTLAVARQFRRDGTVPPRDLIFAFVADEEAGGVHGAQWLVQNHPDLFAGASEAISEVGGFSVTLADDVRGYLVETAQKGSMWLRLAARGVAGHGSMIGHDNAVAKLAAAVARLDRHEFPLVLTGPVRDFLTIVGELTGVPFDPDDPEAAVARLGGLSRMIGATLRNTANVTMFQAGYRSNVVPPRLTRPWTGGSCRARVRPSSGRSGPSSGPTSRCGRAPCRPSRPPSTGTWWTGWRPRSTPRTRRRGSCPTCSRPPPTRNHSSAWGSATSASPR
jgi:acetylornithine deacetylase/succinyl-diaminopimelate desuccinylase-like protein